MKSWIEKSAPAGSFNPAACDHRYLAERWRLLLQICAICSGYTITLWADDSVATVPSRALLVGCTTYAHCRSLKGPSNDVQLIKDLLIDRFGFQSSTIRCLIEGTNPNDQPTRANIVREIETVIQAAKPNERVVLFFAGHGSQQPDQVPSDPNDPEPDGLDEIFLPADAGKSDSKYHAVLNAILDDEFRHWCERLLAKDAEVLMIFDCCHSGTLMRDNEPARYIPMKQLMSAPAVSTDVTPGPSRETVVEIPKAPFDQLKQGRWAALYAAQSGEQTVELKLPSDSPDARWHGLFSYSLCETLHQGAVPSYRELMQRLRGRYFSNGRLAPTPMLEGYDLERTVLGAASSAPDYLLKRNGGGRWILEAGRLQGCSERSILAVRDHRAARESLPKGYVRVVEAGFIQSVVEPCEFEDKPKSTDLPAAGMCRLVGVDYGDSRLRVAIDLPSDTSTKDHEFLKTIRALAARVDSPLRLVDQAGNANWLIRRDQRDEWVLSARNSPPTTEASADAASEYALPRDSVELQEMLRRVNLVCNLLALSSSLGDRGEPDGLRADLKILHCDARVPDKPVPLPFNALPFVGAGDTLQFTVRNRSKRELDFTLLFIDSDFGVQAIFPAYAEVGNNRLAPGELWDKLPPIVVKDDTVGREHLILIATPSSRVPANFAFLEQPSLSSARRERSASSASPLELLLRSIAQGDRVTRSAPSAIQSALIISQSWIVRSARK